MNLNRSKRMRNRRPRTKDERLAEDLARMTLWDRASQPHGYPLCEVCGDKTAEEYQHRKAKVHCTKEELWAPSNGLMVCGHGNVSGCHGHIHQNPTEAYEAGWSVKSHRNPAKVAVLRRGERVLLDDEGGFRAAEEAA